MAQVNPLTRELLVKLVYYGPGLGGKTTSLQCIHSASPPETRGQLVSLATPIDRTLYFDFLPLRARSVRDLHVRLQLFTVPGQVYLNATRKLVLTGVDGLVFVADSQRERHDANLESMENLAANLEEQGRSIHDIPFILQLNKRDLSNVMRVDEMDRSLNAAGHPVFSTVATKGEGVMEALDRLVEDTLRFLEESGKLGEAGEPTKSPSFARAEQALDEQIGQASEEIWKASVERALKQASATPPRPSPPSVPPPPPEPAPSPAAMSAGASASAVAAEPAPRVRPPEPDPVPVPPTSRAAVPFRATPAGPSWAPVFGDQAEAIKALEADMAGGRLADALARCDELAVALLEDIARRALGTVDPGLALSLLDVDGRRWILFRKIVHRAKSGGPVDIRDALQAYSLLIELKLRSDPLA